MPLSDETFQVQLVNVAEIDPDPENGVKGHVRVEFGNSSPDNRWETAAFVKRFPLAPQTAVQIGEALAEAGKALLAKPELAVVGGMEEAEAEAAAHEKLRTEHHPV